MDSTLGPDESSQKLEEMRNAVTRLNDAADSYYNGRGELMTDFEWDALFDRVKVLERETGVILPESPTNKVSADSVEGQKEPHEFPALSLAKTKKAEDVANWAEGRDIWLSWKLDGLTLVVTYDNGELTKVVTRGDGHIGTNITHLADGISGIVRTVKDKGHLVVRGEAVISYADFNEFLAESQEDYANPRNLASGSLTLKDINELKRRKLRWIPFTPVSLPSDSSDARLVGWGERMDYLDSLGFRTVERERIDKADLPSIKAAIERWTRKVTGNENPFPVDGLVVAYDDTDYAKTGSVTGHHATRAGFAFKWQDETASTELTEIEWSCAVGAITPVAIFKPVQLEGTTVQRASLCNISECERLHIGGAGTKLAVIKANKIIPKVVAVTESVGTLEIPKQCPVCGAETKTVESESGTRKLVCTNDDCAARTLRKFIRFVSKDGMDIDGLAGETLAKFINRGWIRTAADIYRLGEHADEIMRMEGFGKKSADNIAKSISNARRRGAVQFLVALNIPLCGIDVAKKLLGKYKVRDLFATAREASGQRDLFSPGPEVFASIDGIGPMKSRAFVEWCANDRNITLVNELMSLVEIDEYEREAAGGLCAGLVFVVTGDVHKYANRNELKAYIESQGGKVTGSVSKSTNYLINNDVTSASTKNRKAHELGISIVSEDEFIARFAPQSDNR